MTGQYRDICLSQRKFYEWVESFEGGLIHILRELGLKCGEVKVQIGLYIQDERRTGIYEMSYQWESAMERNWPNLL